MFQPWRFKLREAQIALDQGRLEEAAGLVSASDLKQYLPVQQLRGQIALQMARRALERAAAADFTAAWLDLDNARDLGGETADWLGLRQAVADVAVSNVIQHLRAFDFAGASKRIESLEKRKVAGAGLTSLLEVSRRLESARKLANRGKFAEADEQLTAAQLLRPDLSHIAEQKKVCQERGEKARVLNEQIHTAMGASDWTKVLAAANELLEMAPDHRVARDARKRAWAEVGERIGDSRRLGETHAWAGSTDLTKDRKSPENDTPRSPRFMLWIDAVGGYLVCLGSDVIVGQAYPGTKIDVPIQADISRRHIRIRREGEGYVLEPLAPKVSIEGKTIAGKVLLADGDEITLNDTVKLRFRKPHVLSASARLELLTPHRTQPFADAVLLMAESCVLGPQWQNHVVCRDWEGDVVLYRSDEKIMCRAMQSIEIDGKLHDGRGAVRPGSHVLGTDFSMTIEAV